MVNTILKQRIGSPLYNMILSDPLLPSCTTWPQVAKINTLYTTHCTKHKWQLFDFCYSYFAIFHSVKVYFHTHILEGENWQVWSWLDNGYYMSFKEEIFFGVVVYWIASCEFYKKVHFILTQFFLANMQYFF